MSVPYSRCIAFFRFLLFVFWFCFDLWLVIRLLVWAVFVPSHASFANFVFLWQGLHLALRDSPWASVLYQLLLFVILCYSSLECLCCCCSCNAPPFDLSFLQWSYYTVTVCQHNFGDDVWLLPSFRIAEVPSVLYTNLAQHLRRHSTKLSASQSPLGAHLSCSFASLIFLYFLNNSSTVTTLSNCWWSQSFSALCVLYLLNLYSFEKAISLLFQLRLIFLLNLPCSKDPFRHLGHYWGHLWYHLGRRSVFWISDFLLRLLAYLDGSTFQKSYFASSMESTALLLILLERSLLAF